MNNLRKYLILLELISFRRIDFDIIKKKYRELAMRLHPDITGRDTNKEMAEINNAYEFLIRNVSAANEELKNIWKEKEAEFARVYRDAILKDLSSATISQLRRSINLFNTIAGYKDVKDLITKYTAELNKKLKEEARKEAIYKDAILDVRKASIGELEKAISLLKSIPNYKDSNNLILIYKNQIDKLKEEIKQNESYYKKLHQIKNDSISDAEFNKIISFLNSYNAPGSDELLNHFYHRQNQFASVEKRLENERNEKIYVVLLSEFNKARTIKDFKDIISKYTKIKNYKNVDSILSQCKSSIENIIAREEYERKEKLYSEAIEYLKQTKDNSMLQKAIDLLKTIRDFKEAEELIAKAVSLIFDNNEEDRKSKIYNKGVSTFEANDFKLLEDILKELNTVDEYKDIDNLKMEYQSKIDKLKDNLYEEAKIDIDNTTIDVLEKSIIILKKIDDYKDSNKLINLYQKKILSIKKEEEAKKKADLEEVYLRGLIGDDEEVTEKLLKDKIKILLSIQSYKESRKIIQSYKKYLSELQSERRKKQFKRYSLLFLKIYLPILIVLLIGTLVTTNVIVPAAQYNQGVNLLESGDYQAALDKFNKVKDKNNVDNLIIAAEAGLLLDTGDYSAAITKLASIDAEINIDYDESTTQLLSMSYIKPNPTENGYSFVRWDLNDHKININNDDVTAKIYLKAVWKINNYQVKFNSNSGEVIPNINFDVEGDDILLPIPTKKGHTFLGWYNNSNFKGSIINKINNGTYENITLYAKWETNTYDLILDYNDETNDTEIIQILYGSKFGNLPIPKRYGYEFLGWYDSNNKPVNSSNNFLEEKSITIFAKWTKEYLVIFKYNDDKTEDSYLEITKNSTYGELPIPERIGYDFLGWYDENDKVIKSSDKYELEKSQTLNAKWQAKSYVITFDYNDDKSNATTRNIFFDSKYETLPDATRKGYEFKGWFDSNDNKVNNDDNYLLEENQTLLAKWKANSYTLTLDFNDNVSENLSKAVVYDEKYGKLPTPTRDGYEFLGWYDNNNLQISEQLIYKEDFNKTIHAKWGIITYTISLNTFDGEIINDIKFNVESNDIELPDGFKYGFRFLGWHNDEDFLSEIIDVIYSGTHSDINLYANFEVIEFKVEFISGKNNNLNPEPQYITHFNNITYPYIESSNESFLGWYDNASLEGNPYDFSLPINNDLVLYAKWSTEKYMTMPSEHKDFTPAPSNTVYKYYTLNEQTVNLQYTYAPPTTVQLYEDDIMLYSNKMSASQGTNTYNYYFTAKPGKVYTIILIPPGSHAWKMDLYLKTQDSFIPTAYGSAEWIADEYQIEYVFNDNETDNLIKPIRYNEYLELVEVERPGYTFLGWYNYKNEKIENSIYKLSRNDRLVAHWTANSYIVSFDYNDGVGEITYGNMIFDKEYGDLPIPTRIGYTFLGWYDENIKINKTTIVKKNSDHTLTAKWQAKEIELTLNYSDEITFSDIKMITYDEIYGDLPIPTRTGYTFLGWYDGELKVEHTTKVKKENDHEITAKWNPNQYILTINYNDGVTSNTIKNITFDEVYGSLPKPEKNGYTFLGWYFDEEIIEEIVIVKKDYDHQIIATWEVTTFNVSFVSNGGTSFDEINFTIYSENIIFPVPEKEGYTFIGWYNNESLLGESFSELLTGTFENMIFYAKWEANEYIITLDRNDGSGIIDEISVIFDLEYNLPKIFRIDYIFEGWFLEQNYDYEIKSTDLLKIAKNHRVYAMWVEGTDLFEFEKTDNHYKITSFDKTATIAIVPNTYRGLPVRLFNVDVFQDTNLEEITLPNSISSIAMGSFKGSNNLIEMTIPFVGESRTRTDSRESIFGYIFGEHVREETIRSSFTTNANYYVDFEKDYQLSAGISGVVWQWTTLRVRSPLWTFYDYTSYFYFIPKSLKKINITDATNLSFAAFHNLDFIEEINLNEGIEYIGPYAFTKVDLEYLNIPDTVITIDANAFENSKIKNIEFSNESGLKTIGSNAFYGAKNLESITIPNEVINIGEYAFRNSDIETIDFKDDSNLKSIRSLTFSNMLKLKNITIPRSVTEIGSYAFSDSTKIENIIFESGSNLKTIGQYAFNNNNSLKSIQLPESLTTIGNSAFFGASSLESISIPFVGNYKGYGNAFGVIFGTTSYNGSYNANSYYIPNTLTEVFITNEKEIGSAAFKNVSKIENITITDGLTSIGSEAFSGVNSLTSFVVPDSVTYIGMSAFSNINGIETITIPFIGSGDEPYANTNNWYFGYIFNQTGYLGSFDIPASLKTVIITKAETIWTEAFNDATNITNISLPSNLNYISKDAFNQATSLVSIIVDEQNQHYTSEDGILFDKDKTEIIKYPSGKTDSVYIIPNSVTTIKAWSFYRTSFLEKVIIPSSVLNIEQYAFWFLSDPSFFLEVEEKPIDWHNNWNEDKDVYWLSEWYYNDFGEPTPL